MRCLQTGFSLRVPHRGLVRHSQNDTLLTVSTSWYMAVDEKSWRKLPKGFDPDTGCDPRWSSQIFQVDLKCDELKSL